MGVIESFVGTLTCHRACSAFDFLKLKSKGLHGFEQFARLCVQCSCSAVEIITPVRNS